MNYKLFKGVARSLAQGNAWKTMVHPQITPGPVILSKIPAHFNAGGATVAFTKQSVEGEQRYNHFCIEAHNVNTPAAYKEWWMSHMADIKVKVEGEKQDVLEVLEHMEGDASGDGTWAADSRSA